MDLAAVVARALKTYDWRLVELEFRLGRPGARFDPDVGAACFDRVRALAEGWVTAGEARALGCASTVDVTAGELRATTSDEGVVVTRKKRVADADFPGGRMSVSLETSADDPPPTAGHVRRKCRRSYAVGRWRVDLTRVVPSADLDCDAATYEVEVELADPDEFFKVPLGELVADGKELLAALGAA